MINIIKKIRLKKMKTGKKNNILQKEKMKNI